MEMPEKTYRGIKVKHFRSCQYLEDIDVNVLVDYYFSSSSLNNSLLNLNKIVCKIKFMIIL